ncbi:MAG: hypothetical protein AABW79_02790 [Nanoarchaeota archaeon]
MTCDISGDYSGINFIRRHLELDRQKRTTGLTNDEKIHYRDSECVLGQFIEFGAHSTQEKRQGDGVDKFLSLVDSAIFSLKSIQSKA